MIQLIAMVIIGALIGGGTNYLAIKMLFHPYKKLMIGKFAIPFTPGLIPKRHDEIAIQLGRIVEEYLVTEEVMSKLISSPSFHEATTKKIATMMEQLLFSTKSSLEFLELLPNELQDFLTSQAGIKNFNQSFWIKSLTKWLGKHIHLPIEAWMKLSTEQREKISNFLAHELIHVLREYLSSSQGKTMFIALAGSILQQKNSMFQFFANLFVNEEKLAELILPKLEEILASENTELKLAEQINKLLHRFMEKKLLDLFPNMAEEDLAIRLFRTLKVPEYLERIVEMPVENWGSRLYPSISPYFSTLTSWLMAWVAKQIGHVYRSLNLTSLVANEVRSFPIAKLEEMILAITARELRAITYLGALIGGIIGFMQYFIVHIT